MTSAFSWQNSISLCPTSFCTPRPNLPVTPCVSWLPTFAFQSLIMRRTSLLGIGSKRSCRSSWRSEVAQPCPTLWDPMDCSLPGPPPMGLSRQGYWRGLPFPIEPGSPALRAVALPSKPPVKYRGVSLHRTLQIQLLQHYWSGHRLVLLWYWMLCLGNEQRSFCHFWDCIQVLDLDSCWLWWLLHFF